ncbi:THO complex subunit 1-like [Anneissia japonica]|uniref:THO complex subunit 1-like n=1 Tax=Anneissia japonica TaxID=1529436 RepID=UPI0014259002|nr:THO complex subunit 1-like [Anneissia japonica]
MAAATFDYALARQQYSVAIQSALPSKDLKELLESTASIDGSDNEKKPALDQAFRDVLWKLVVDERHYSEYLRLIQLSIDAVENSLSSAYTPFLLLGDLFDTVTIETCKEVFKFVEEQVMVWKSDTFYIAGKNYILRMCNDLLRRLSKSQNTVFCGRIQLFLARFFPLDERSGLNLMSQFNLANVTTFNTTDSEVSLTLDADKPTSMNVDVTGPEAGKTEKPIDYILYRKFWSLQDFFRNPTQCYKKEKWRQFQKYSKVVLDAFTSLKLDAVQGSKSRKHQARQKLHKQSKDQVYFAKFLTSEKLFDLQIHDSSFRRSVLVQFLILYQYLNQTVKFKTGTHVLTDEMSNHIKESTEVVYMLLRETPPNGEEFAKTVEHILTREEHWNDWKNKGCPTFVLERPKDGEEAAPVRSRSRKRSIREEMLGEGTSKRLDMGSPELTKLWNLCPDNMEACRSEARIFLPNLEEFFEEAIEQADPEAMIEDEYKVVNQSNFAWQAVRLLAGKSPHFFQPVIAEPPIKKLSQYLEWILTKIAKEMPQTLSTSEEIKTGEGLAETDDLLQGGEEEKSDVLTEDQLEAVISKIGDNWMTLAGELFLSDDDISNLQTELSDAKEQARQLLNIWQEREGTSATKEVLVGALQESGLKDIVESVFSNSQAEM